MRVRSSSVVLALLLLTSTACGDDSISAEGSPVGTYVLATINNQPLPFVVFDGLDGKLEITEGHVTLSVDETCSTSATFRTTESGTVTTDTQTESCTWSRNVNAVQFTWSDGAQSAGSWSEETLSITEDGVRFVFQRQ